MTDHNLPSPSIKCMLDTRVPMRDGINLSADIYLPDAPNWIGPCVLVTTPYDNTMDLLLKFARYYVAADYGYIIVDVRGRGDSEGTFQDSIQLGPDMYDCIEWIAEQSWCDSNVGMMGASYLGGTQWSAAREHPPHLKTIIPTAPGGKIWGEIYYTNGLPCLWNLPWMNAVSGKTLQWNTAQLIDWKKVCFHLPLNTMDKALGRSMPRWAEYMEHSTLDDYWKRYIFTDEHFASINIPALTITGWFDGDQLGSLFFYEGMINHSPAKDNQYMIIGPWDHGSTYDPRETVGKINFGKSSLLDLIQIHLDWFDFWLKGKDNKVDQWPKTQVFELGSNTWRSSSEIWPPRDNSSRIFYLDSKGNAQTANGNGILTPSPKYTAEVDQYIYDPEDPILVTSFNQYAGSLDLRSKYFDDRTDAVFYTSAPILESFTIAGTPTIEFYGSSDCLDTDWVTLFSLVEPNGDLLHFRSDDFHGGVLRARFRNSFESPELLEPGKIYKFTLTLSSMCVKIFPGQRIRLLLNSSAFPTYARNQNTGNDIGTDTEIKVATNSIHHSAEFPSKLIIPIFNNAIPASETNLGE